jgi:ATP-dependent protease ClpP protease subunit
MTGVPKTGASTPTRSKNFPRTNELPTQSPKYWAKEKDRYLRQLLIEDIEAVTQRPLFIYFSQLDQEINHTDPDDLSEILQAIDSDEADFLIQTPGGLVDATEKLISLLSQKFKAYRVIVPSWAKSAGTVIAMSASEIVFGINSELGPIDPQWKINGNMIPCEILAKDDKIPQHLRDLASLAALRMAQMARDILAKGMFNGKGQAEIEAVITKISSSNGYMSHGAVIDFSEAKKLGLSVSYLDPNDDTWRRIWLLYCMYDFDTKARNLGKIFEGNRFSIARPR